MAERWREGGAFDFDFCCVPECCSHHLCALSLLNILECDRQHVELVSRLLQGWGTDSVWGGVYSQLNLLGDRSEDPPLDCSRLSPERLILSSRPSSSYLKQNTKSVCVWLQNPFWMRRGLVSPKVWYFLATTTTSPFSPQSEKRFEFGTQPWFYF